MRADGRDRFDGAIDDFVNPAHRTFIALRTSPAENMQSEAPAMKQIRTGKCIALRATTG